MQANDTLGIPKTRIHEVWLYTDNGYGSSGTNIRRWSTIGTYLGNAITYWDDAIFGGSFTINQDGRYAISYTDQFTGGTTLGISLNSTQLTTNVDVITASTLIAIGITAGANVSLTVSVPCIFLKKGDVIRAHTRGTSNGTQTYAEQFRIAKLNDG